MRKLLGSIFLFLLSFCALAQRDTVLLEDLKYGWIKLENDEVVPVTKVANVDLISFAVALKEDQIIQICNDQPFDVWVNLELIKHQITSCVSLETNHLNYLPGDSLFIQVSASNGLAELQTQLFQVVPGVPDDINLRDKPDRYFQDFFLINLLMLVFLAAGFKRFYPRRFSRFLSNPLKSRSLSTIDDFYSDFFGMDNLLMILFFATLSGFGLTYFGVKLNIMGQAITSLNSLLTQELMVIGSVISLVLAKYLLSILFSLFFHFREVSNVQNQDFMNFFSWIAFFVLVLACLDFSWAISAWSGLSNLLAYVLIISLIIFQIGVYFKIDKLSSHQKIMIISYLCTTEFIPGFILIYLLVK